MRFLKRILVSVYTYAAVFFAICLILYICTGDEPVALISGVAGAMSVESIISGMIKDRETQAAAKTQEQELRVREMELKLRELELKTYSGYRPPEGE